MFQITSWSEQELNGNKGGEEKVGIRGKEEKTIWEELALHLPLLKCPYPDMSILIIKPNICS